MPIGLHRIWLVEIGKIANKELFAFTIDIFNIGDLEWWLALFEHSKHTNFME